ncbi:MAG: Uma2 family endonuclease [Gemmataceae bacterium]|nr:Uma2 family endonuclease [Gemmataceae bacterium]
MSAAPQRRKMTVAEYLERERTALEKSEYLDGETWLLHPPHERGMAGASRSHNTVNENLSGELYARLRGTGCRTFSRDLKVRCGPTGLFTYPDLVIVCGDRQFAEDDPDVLLNPAVIFEVLSPTTERYDRVRKFDQYGRIASFREYVLIAQDEPLVERYVRQPDGSWNRTVYAGLDAELPLATVPVRLPLSAIYADVTFPETPPQ